MGTAALCVGIMSDGDGAANTWNLMLPMPAVLVSAWKGHELGLGIPGFHSGSSAALCAMLTLSAFKGRDTGQTSWT